MRRAKKYSMRVLMEVVLNLISVLLINSDTFTMKPLAAIAALFPSSTNTINSFLLTIYLTILVVLISSCLSCTCLLLWHISIWCSAHASASSSDRKQIFARCSMLSCPMLCLPLTYSSIMSITTLGGPFNKNYFHFLLPIWCVLQAPDNGRYKNRDI